MARTKKRFHSGGDAASSSGKGGGGGWDQRFENSTAPHEGSVPLEEIKSSAEYARRIENYNINPTKHKFAMCFGYIGSNYDGLQLNKDASSVEACLEKALFLAGAIQEFNYGNLHKIQWTRAARTDKGVHAISQCCAMKIHAPTAVAERPAFVEQVNGFLPADIRVFGLTKVAKSFNSKNAVTKRRYQYLLPTFVLDDCANTNAIFDAALKKQAEGPSQHHDPSSNHLSSNTLREVYGQLKGYRVSDQKLALLRQALSAYVGTKRYHNFTPRMAADDNRAKRYIISFESGDAFVDPASGGQWVLLSVTGQSFMLNQIRKMVGLAVNVARGAASLASIDEAFDSKKVAVPTAPGIGLYLDQLYFDQYNKVQGFRADGDRKRKAHAGEVEGVGEAEEAREKLDWHDDAVFVAAMSTFRDSLIRPHVLAEEGKQLSFVSYLSNIRSATFEEREEEGGGGEDDEH